MAAEASLSVVTIVLEQVLNHSDSWQRVSDRRSLELADPLVVTGSGVIVDSAGYILTNYHVVRGSVRLRVRLADHREVKPTLVVVDPHTDLAVLKVEEHGLSALPTGNSDELRVGEWILVIGNPFGGIFERTVTAGIVSAKGRSNLQFFEHEDFIQIDAAINPGNSGGALVNARGELGGIITASVNLGGIGTGIGFAIPINRARQVLKTVRKEGRMLRGFLGVKAQDLTPELAEALAVPKWPAALLSSVLEHSPAEKAGLLKGDVVIAFDGNPIEKAAELRNSIAESLPGTKVKVQFYRRGEREHVEVEVEERPEPPTPRGEVGSQLQPARQDLGFTLRALTPALAEDLGYSKHGGLLVVDVVPGAAAHRSGLLPWDLIEEVDGRTFDVPEDFFEFAESRQGGKPLLLSVRSGSIEKLAALKLR